MRTKLLVAIAAVGAVTAVPGTASATYTCVETNRVTFSPALGTNVRTGTYSFSWQKQCVRDNGTLFSASGSLTYGYTGSCTLATISTGAMVVGGLAHVEPHLVSKNGVYVPDSGNPCAFSTGTLYSVQRA